MNNGNETFKAELKKAKTGIEKAKRTEKKRRNINYFGEKNDEDKRRK